MNINTNNQSHVNNPINKVILEIFSCIAEYEKKIEVIRQVMNDHIEFDPVFIFDIFDKNNENKLNSECIMKFLKSKLIFTDIETIKMLISFYDANMDGNLDFEEFKNWVISQKNPVLKINQSTINTSKSYIIKEQVEATYPPVYSVMMKLNLLPEDISHTLVKLFINEIQFSNKMIELLKKLYQTGSYNVFNLFKQIDQEGKDFITEDMLIDFLKSNKFKLSYSNSSLKAIFERMDINRDKVISFIEFKVFFSYRNYSHISGLENYELSQNKAPLSMERSFYGGKSTTRGGSIASSYLNTQEENLFYNSGSNADIKFTSTNNTPRVSKSMNVDEKSLSKTFYGVESGSNIKHSNYSNFKTLEEEMLINYLKFAISAEKELEEMKCDLAKCLSFNINEVYSIFQKLNNSQQENSFTNHKTYQLEDLTKEDFKLGLNNFGSFPTSDELNLIFEKFSRSRKQNSLINFIKFSDIFLPLTNSELQFDLKYRRVKSFSQSDEGNYNKLNKDISTRITSLFNKIIITESKLEAWRIKLNKIRTFNLQKLFDNICFSSDKYITQKDLELYLGKFSISDQIEVSLLFKRFDRDERNKISYSNVSSSG